MTQVVVQQQVLGGLGYFSFSFFYSQVYLPFTIISRIGLIWDTSYIWIHLFRKQDQVQNKRRNKKKKKKKKKKKNLQKKNKKRLLSTKPSTTPKQPLQMKYLATNPTSNQMTPIVLSKQANLPPNLDGALSEKTEDSAVASKSVKKINVCLVIFSPAKKYASILLYEPNHSL